MSRPARRWVAAVCLVGLLGAAFVLLLRPRSPLRVLDDKGSGIQAISIDRFGKRPWIDVKLPLFGKLTYPEALTTVVHLNRKTMSGIVRQKPLSTSSGGWAVVGEYWKFGEDSRYFSWKVIQGALEDSPCPLVFGNAPVRALDTGDNAVPIPFLLPANGIPEPPLPSRSASVGPHTLHLKAGRWISPIFPLTYEVWVDGPPGSLYRVRLDLHNKSGRDASHRYFVMFCEPPKRTDLYIIKWPTQCEVKATVALLKGERVGLKVTKELPMGVSLISDRNPPWFTLQRDSRRSYDVMFGDYPNTGFYLRDAKHEIAGIQIGTKTYFQEADEDFDEPFIWDADGRLAPGVKGRTLQGVIYTYGVRGSVTFDFPLPDWKTFCEDSEKP